MKNTNKIEYFVRYFWEARRGTLRVEMDFGAKDLRKQKLNLVIYRERLV